MHETMNIKLKDVSGRNHTDRLTASLTLSVCLCQSNHRSILLQGTRSIFRS